MSAARKTRMDADAFQRWVARQPRGRYELDGGDVVPMAPERAIHVQVKTLVWLALRTAVQSAGYDGQAFGDGLSVRIDEETVYEPDALLREGRLGDDVVEIDDPIVVVEVSSPSSGGLDSGEKLAGYFRLPSVQHYLVVNARRRSIVQHRRAASGRIETGVLPSGMVLLDPPGLTFTVEECFPAA